MTFTALKKSIQRDFFILFFRELKVICRSRALLFMTLVFPLFLIFFFCTIFQNEVIQKLPVSVVDLDNTAASRKIIQNVAATPEVNVVRRDTNLLDAKQALLERKVYGILLFPAGFEKKMLGGNSPEVTGFYNNQFMSAGSALNSGFSKSLSASLSSIQKENLLSQGMSSAVAEQQMSPIQLDVSSLFNPTLNYVFTLVNGVFPTVLQLIIMVCVCYSTVRDRFNLTGLYVPFKMANFSVFRYILNRILPYVLLFLFVLLIFNFVLVMFFNLPIRGSLVLLFVSATAFIIASSLCAMMIAVWMPVQAMCYGATSIVASPAFGFIGLFFPRLAMSAFANFWASILPITWYIELRIDQTLRGVDTLQSLLPLLWMLLIGLVAYAMINLKFWLLLRSQHAK